MINIDELKASLTSPFTLAQYISGFLLGKTDKEKYDIVLAMQGEFMTLLIDNFEISKRHNKIEPEFADATMLCCACITAITMLKSEQAFLMLDLTAELSKRMITDDWISVMKNNKDYLDSLN